MRVARTAILGLASLGAVGVMTLVLLGGASADVTGSGKHRDDLRKIGGFDQIDISGALQVQIQVGGAASEVLVAGDDNLVALVESTVKDGTLHLSTREAMRPRSGLTVSVRLPTLREIEASGAVRASAKGVASDQLKVELSGASKAEVEGKVKKLEAELSGASTLTAVGLQAETVEVDASGASTVTVTARREITGEASGASHVKVHGNPGTVNVETSGASSVNRKG